MTIHASSFTHTTAFKITHQIDKQLDGPRSPVLRLPRRELLDVHGVDDVGAAVERCPGEQHVHPLRRVEGVPEDVGVAVQARPQERQAGDHATVPPDAAAPAVHHAEPCSSQTTTAEVQTHPMVVP